MSASKTKVNELECGDIIIMQFSPTEGHEQSRNRPAVILSNPKQQDRLLDGLVSVAPVTNTKRGFPLDVELDSRTKTQGVILMGHHRMVDLKARGFQYVEKIPKDNLEKCEEILVSLYEELVTYSHHL